MEKWKLAAGTVSIAAAGLLLANCFGGYDSGLTYTPVSDTVASVDGTIGSGDIEIFESFIAANPNIQTLEFGFLPGSVDDETNLQLARLVRAKGLDIHLSATSEAHSGGVDLFVAGVERTLECGAVLGVHTWGGFGYAGSDLPRDPAHPEHQPYIQYYKEMGLPDPEGFYFFTLDAAPLEDTHAMTVEEINQYGLTTTPMSCGN